MNQAYSGGAVRGGRVSTRRSRTKRPLIPRALRLHEYYTLNIGGEFSDAHWGPGPYARSLLHDFSLAMQDWEPMDGPPESLCFPDAVRPFDFDAVAATDAPLEVLEAWPKPPVTAMPLVDQELIEPIGLMEYRP